MTNMINQQFLVLGKKIKKLRKKVGLTQKEFGVLLNLSGAAIGYLENGKRKINAVLLKRMADILKKPVNYFYNRHDETSTIKEELRGIEKQLQEIAIKCAEINE